MNTSGRLFRVGVLGSSHGQGVGAIVEGCPAGLPLREEDFEEELSRRRAGAPGTTSRVEADRPSLRSGLFEGHTTGQPILIWFENHEARSTQGEDRRRIPRPGHVDLAATRKAQGFNDPRGGGSASGRMTVALVAAGVIARKLLPEMTFTSRILAIGGVTDPSRFEARLERARPEGDTLGGVLECRVRGVPAGLGEPFFDPLDGRLAALAFSIPGIHAFAMGDGLEMAAWPGSEANDAILDASGRTATNHAGGINGGISNGNELVFRLWARPAPSTALPQQSVDLLHAEPVVQRLCGRDDTCYALRLSPVIEACAACALTDFMRLSGRLGEVWAG